MKIVRMTFWVAFLFLLLTGAAQANALADTGSEITVVGMIVVMDDGIYLDEGSRRFLLIDTEDSQYDGLTAEVIGELIMIDDIPAIRVHEITIFEDRPAGDNEEGSSPNNG